MNNSFKFLKNKDDDKIGKFFIDYPVTLIPVVNSNVFLKDLVKLEQFLKV